MGKAAGSLFHSLHLTINRSAMGAERTWMWIIPAQKTLVWSRQHRHFPTIGPNDQRCPSVDIHLCWCLCHLKRARSCREILRCQKAQKGSLSTTCHNPQKPKDTSSPHLSIRMMHQTTPTERIRNRRILRSPGSNNHPSFPPITRFFDSGKSLSSLFWVVSMYGRGLVTHQEQLASWYR